MTEGMRAFAKRYKVSLNDPDLRRMYDYEMSAKRDQASRDYNTTLKAYENVVRNALKQNLSNEVIYALLPIPYTDVDAIIAKIRAEN